MARHDDRNWILCHGLTDFLRGMGLAGGFGDFSVSARLPRRNFARHFVHLPDKQWQVLQIHGNSTKVLSFSLQVTPNFLDD